MKGVKNRRIKTLQRRNSQKKKKFSRYTRNPVTRIKNIKRIVDTATVYFELGPNKSIPDIMNIKDMSSC